MLKKFTPCDDIFKGNCRVDVTYLTVAKNLGKIKCNRIFKCLCPTQIFVVHVSG
jgi:hypothetical protein